MNPNIIGNITTIIKILIMTVAPAIAVYIGTDEQTIITFLTAIAGAIVMITIFMIVVMLPIMSGFIC